MPLVPPVISLFQFNSFHTIYKIPNSAFVSYFGITLVLFDNPQFQCKFQSLFLFPIIYTAFSFVLDRLSSLSMDFHQSRPILQLAESSHKTHIVRVPAYAFSRLVSPSLLSFCSPFYEAFLNRHDTNFTTSSCSHCGSKHSRQQFCLPSDYSPTEVNVLLDFLKRTPHVTFASDLFHSYQ